MFGSGSMVFTATLFLLGSSVTYFFHFAVTLLATLAATLLLGMFLMVTLLNIVGPEGKQGEFMPCMTAGDTQKVVPDSSGAPASVPGAVGSPQLAAVGTGRDSDSDSDDDLPTPSQAGVRKVVPPPGGAVSKTVPPPPAGARRAPVPPPPGRAPGAQARQPPAPLNQGPLPPMPPSPAAAPAPAAVQAQDAEPYGKIPEVAIESAVTTPANSASRNGRAQQTLN